MSLVAHDIWREDETRELDITLTTTKSAVSDQGSFVITEER